MTNMIRLQCDAPAALIPPLSYTRGRPILWRCIAPATRYLRAVHAGRYTSRRDARLLDVGCGDGYFLRRSACRERHGADLLLGDDICRGLDAADASFEYITMLAVIEHLADVRAALREVHRLLAPEGLLIVTTPKRFADRLIRLYVRDVDQMHETYFDERSLRATAHEWFDVVEARTFLFGLNQVFCLRKRLPPMLQSIAPVS
ncbi:MAG: class I SAM-dependent methyltransferase [Candidatus Omnitrophica bacterium]|nr:class I SAM-dependent methyltransferase [Candidatus Omnitrophota bacterium]